MAKMIQLYITGACEMRCPHCTSREQEMPNMTVTTLKEAIRVLERDGVTRVELFANDPLLHPEINEFIRVLNESSLGYAVLTVGASPENTGVKERFLSALELVDPEKGAFVFSVDYTQETADRILAEVNDNAPYAFKAKTFWEMAPLLQKKRMPVRINVVISRHNIDEVAEIIRRVAEMGFATSFCFVQHRQVEFDELSRKGLTPELEQGFRDFMKRSALLEVSQIDVIVSQVRDIIAGGQLENRTKAGERLQRSPFNAFRGDNRDEVDIEPEKLVALRQDLLNLKMEFGGDKVLPDKGFIERLGDKGFGCIELLKQGQFPQLKIGSKGQMIFCCDLHDPQTQTYHITDMDDDKRESFLRMLRSNPYIWICVYFNTCDFSVNYVLYGARTDKFVRIVKEDLPLAPEKLEEARRFCVEQIEARNFRVLGQIPEMLRVDWLDTTLDEPIRANKHTNVYPVEWRTALEDMCETVVRAYLQERGEGKNVVALLMWRAALAYHKALATHGIRQCHIDVKRNEVTLEIAEFLSLNEVDEKLLRSLAGKDGQVFLPDPMLASGASMCYAIDMVRGLGIENNQITVGCVIAAPEGVFNLLSQFPGIRIIVVTMDGRLNGNAYIVDEGLGDAGAKYFCGNTPKNFRRDVFTVPQWAHLMHLLEAAKE